MRLYLCCADPPEASVCNEIISAGGEINYTDSKGNSALIDAAKNSTTTYDVFKVLVKAGADVTQMNDHQLTPLSSYLEEDHVIDTEVIKMLIEAGKGALDTSLALFNAGLHLQPIGVFKALIGDSSNINETGYDCANLLLEDGSEDSEDEYQLR